MYRLKISRRVKHQIDTLPRYVRQQVRRLVESLANEPRPKEAKELRDVLGRCRTALQHWRVIYRVDDQSIEVVVLAVRRKAGPETYEGLES